MYCKAMLREQLVFRDVFGSLGDPKFKDATAVCLCHFEDKIFNFNRLADVRQMPEHTRDEAAKRVVFLFAQTTLKVLVKVVNLCLRFY